MSAWTPEVREWMRWAVSRDDYDSVDVEHRHLRACLEHIDALEARVREAEEVIAWANNSLHGSHGFFLSTCGGPSNPHHLDTPIEDLKAYGNRQWRRAEAAEARVAVLAAECKAWRMFDYENWPSSDKVDESGECEVALYEARAATDANGGLS